MIRGESRYYDQNTVAFKKGTASLVENGYRPIQRPHRKLPALLTYWDKLLKESDCPVTWYSKKIKGRRTAVYAVSGAHYINNGTLLAYCTRIFGDIETAEYEENHP